MSRALRAAGAIMAFGVGVLAWHLNGNAAGWSVAIILIVLATAIAEAGNHVRQGNPWLARRGAVKEGKL